mmetsp:Transcript_19745/g.50127  ORF Transcript_19745/g.50127 Transcript_19745/m.50127 type:complete len:354 (+) Transcript_19745:122-1183(+)|eukprot:CAMPEP_0177657446 /NCGR_PEP_ID=MMETSP0447-20121125/16192_1 /TAXON_ID=0 /ORGANISM="Stygamoeba regulata, Strain BSH-02190019" /LENGTH=353 /DNA_ID=CAMNT_0019161807 /DNA_START=117 /DNA_END=1178 /DNA_ORIENTATION=-
MGNCASGGTPEDREARKRNREIEHTLNKDGRKFREEVKLLLLGPGESGKSTIFKQMKIIQKDGGFSDDELAGYKYIVRANCITQMKTLLVAQGDLNVTFEKPENEPLKEMVLDLPSTGDSWSANVGTALMSLWADQGIRETFSHRDRSFQLNDSAEYFFSNLPRFNEPDYLPSYDDVLRARIRTTGIEEAKFEFDNLMFRMVDVGGQRAERRKWIHCFDSVTAVIFCASISEYDQTLREDTTQKRMKESLLLFDEICNSPYFKETSFVLFLNKMDIFEEKIQRVPLTICFPEYSGGSDKNSAVEFIKGKFLEQNTSSHVVYIHETCAIDTENVKFVWKAVRETILHQVLDEIF